MNRPAALLLSSLVGVLGLGLAVPAVGQAALRQRTEESPLAVHLSGLSPAVLPARGAVRVTGTVTNVSGSTSRDVRVYPMVGGNAITTVADLDITSQTLPGAVVGDRITDAAVVDELGDLEPGQSARFEMDVPRASIVAAGINPSSPGTYWFGAHALHDDDDGIEKRADGRARTFLTVMPPTSAPVKAAVVVPVRRAVTYAPNGQVAELDSWLDDLRRGGRLDNLVDFGGAQPAGSLTWLVDPAVLDAAERLADGNPARSLTTSASTPAASPSGTESPEGTSQQSSTRLDEVRELAADWLERFDLAVQGSQVLGLPYGDVSVASALAHGPQVLIRARELAAKAFEARDIDDIPAVAAPGGGATAELLAPLPVEVVTLASDDILGNRYADAATEPTGLLVGGHQVALYDDAASSGGPAPDAPFAPIALRQRILAEAAVRSLQEQADLVVALPADWDPGPGTPVFAAALAQPWLSLASLTEVVDQQQPIEPSGLLDPPAPEVSLGRDNFRVVTDVSSAGRTLQSILEGNSSIADEVSAAALPTVSYAAEVDPARAVLVAEGQRRSLRGTLGKVKLTAPPYVTLSSNSGRFRVDLENDLDQPVVVKIAADISSPIEIQAPGEIRLEAGGTTSVLLNARSHQLGVHQIRLRVTDRDGAPLGTSTPLPIRANEVGQIVWVIIAVGGTMFAAAILMRLRKRFAVRRTAGADPEGP